MTPGIRVWTVADGATGRTIGEVIAGTRAEARAKATAGDFVRPVLGRVLNGATLQLRPQKERMVRYG